MYKRLYTSPRVMRCQHIEMESTLLSESVVTQSTVIETTGQEIGGYYDVSGDSTFNHEWEE